MHFCKRLPLWANLNEDIQIRLIKGGLTEAMILFNTRDYDSKRDEVKFMDGKLRSKEAFYASGFNSEMIDGKWIKNDNQNKVARTRKYEGYHEMPQKEFHNTLYI